MILLYELITNFLVTKEEEKLPEKLRRHTPTKGNKEEKERNRERREGKKRENEVK